MHDDPLDERAAELLREAFEKLPDELRTPPAAVSGGPVAASVDEFPRRLVDEVEAAIWEHNKVYSLVAQELPQYYDRFFPLHLSLNPDGTWHVEEGEKCWHPLDANYSFYVQASMTRESCRSAAHEALGACTSHLSGRAQKTSIFGRFRRALRGS